MNDDSTDDYPPLSALNDLLFCERRCALHRIEQVWVDNSLRSKAHAGIGVRICHCVGPAAERGKSMRCGYAPNGCG